MESKAALLQQLKEIEADEIQERYRHIQMFKFKMDNLISNTPTGELRNSLSELNILFESIIN